MKTGRVGVIVYRNADGTFQDVREIGKCPGPEMDPEENNDALKTFGGSLLPDLLASMAAERK